MTDFKEIMEEIPQPLWDNWYITDRIGSGASGVVYRIEAKRDGRTDISALKIEPILLDREIVCDEAQKKTLLEQKRREAVSETAIMYKLKNCPYIVSYEDENILPLKCIPGYLLLIRMEYLMELPQLVKKGGFPPTEENILRLAANIGRGINAAHKLGIYHRDIKPSNFFAAPDGTFKLGDFNISGSGDSSRPLAGTPGYIAPEIYRSESTVMAVYTERADIYSFGICLYQLMNDFFFPFEDSCTAENAIERRMCGEPLPMPKKASPDFGRIILRACAYDPALRYGSMDEMLCELENLRARRSAVINTSAPVYASAAMPQPAPAVMPVIRPEQREKRIVRPSSKLLPILLLLLILSVIALIFVLISTGKNEKGGEKEKAKVKAFEKTPYSLGDVDGDGIITGSDAAMILHEYTLMMSDDSSFAPKQVKAADVNGDGLINGTDAALVQRYYTLLSSANGKEFPSIEEWIREND